MDVGPLCFDRRVAYTVVPDGHTLLVGRLGEGQVGLEDELVGGVQIEEGVVRTTADHAETIPSSGRVLLHFLPEDRPGLEVVMDLQGFEGRFQLPCRGREDHKQEYRYDDGLEQTNVHGTKVAGPSAVLDHLCAPRSTNAC